MFVLTNLKSR